MLLRRLIMNQFCKKLICLELSVKTMSSEVRKGPSLDSVVSFLENFAPKTLSEKWDNTGLLIEPFSKRNINKILLTNDLTEVVMKEALQMNAELIISYHPPIFEPLKNISSSNWKGRIISACLENKIAVYSPHTSWDSVQGGINDWLASAFDCETIDPICHSNNDENRKTGAGRYCKLKQKITLLRAINNIKNLIGQSNLQVALAQGTTLESDTEDVAICAGSGASILTLSSAKLFVTGEMSHHSLLDATHKGSTVILCNHSNSERGFLKYFSCEIEKYFSSENLQAFVSKEDKDPLQFI